MPPEEKTQINLMRQTAEKAIRRTAKREGSALDRDEPLFLALNRRREIIGKAAGHVAESTRSRPPDISRVQIIGMPNRLIDGYEGMGGMVCGQP